MLKITVHQVQDVQRPPMLFFLVCVRIDIERGGGDNL